MYIVYNTKLKKLLKTMLINIDSRQHTCNDKNVYHLKHNTITTFCTVIQSEIEPVQGVESGFMNKQNYFHWMHFRQKLKNVLSAGVLPQYL